MRKIIFTRKGKRITYEELYALIYGKTSIDIPFDIINEIVKYITCGKTFKEILRLNTACHATHKHKTDTYTNVLWTLIHKYPNENWNWYRIIQNPNTTLNIIEHEIISKEKPSTTITGVSVIKDLNKGFSKQLGFGNWWWPLLHNPNLTPEFIKKHSKRKKWTCNYVNDGTLRRGYESPYSNPAISMDIVSEHLSAAITTDEKQFIIKGAVNNPNLSEEFIEKHIDLIINFHFQTDIIHNSSIRFGFLIDLYLKLNRPIKPVFVFFMFFDPNITLDYVLNFGSELNPHVLRELSKSHVITLQDVIDRPELPWSWPHVSMNPNITIDLIEKHIDNESIMWCPSGLSSNPNLTIEFVKKYIDPFALLNKKNIKGYGNIDGVWNWYAISKNANITMNDFENNLLLPWNVGGILENPNLSLHVVEKYFIGSKQNAHGLAIYDVFDKISSNRFGL